MSMKNHYKEKFWDYSNDELKDIIAGRFMEPSDDEVEAAMELIKERHDGPINEHSELSLAQIPSASIAVLLEIVKNPQLWSQDAVEIAEAEILRREKAPNTSSEKGGNTLLKGVLAIIGVIGTILFVKLIAVLIFLAFMFYSIESCMHNL